MTFGLIKAAQQIVGRNPPIQAFCDTGNHLDMSVAVGKQKVRIGARVGADLFEKQFPFQIWQQSHSRSGKEENRGVSNRIVRDDIARMFE